MAYTPSQVERSEKNFNHKNYKEYMLTLAVNKHLSMHFFPQRPRLFLHPTEMYGPNPLEKGIEVFYSAPTQ